MKRALAILYCAMPAILAIGTVMLASLWHPPALPCCETRDDLRQKVEAILEQQGGVRP